MSLEQLRESLPDVARDIKVNLGNLLGQGQLAPEQRYGVAAAVALSQRSGALAAALIDDGKLPALVLEDAKAAATLMAMTNVYYSFKHHVSKSEYQELPARLRMQRLAQPASSKINLELFSLAVSAVYGCPDCIRSHERILLENGLTVEQVHEAVRIAAVVNATVTALEVGRYAGQAVT